MRKKLIPFYFSVLISLFSGFVFPQNLIADANQYNNKKDFE